MRAPPSLALRSARALFCLWLAFVLTQPVAVHACAMRNGTLMAAPAGHHMAPADHAAAAMHHDASSPAGQTNHGCHCFGECSASVPVALVAPQRSIPAPPELLAQAGPLAHVERVFEEPDHHQPPATAPPTAPVTV